MTRHATSTGKRSSFHPLGPSLLTRLLEDCQDIRTMRELLGQQRAQTTRIYTHAIDAGPRAVFDPIGDLKCDS